MQITQELCKRPGLNRAGFEMPTIFVPSLTERVSVIVMMCIDSQSSKQWSPVTGHFLIYFSIWLSKVQFGRTNLLYIFNGESLTMCNSVTSSNVW